MSKRKNLNNVDLSFHLQHPGKGSEPGDPNAIFYLNGVYHGIHNVRSKLNGEYVKQHYGIAKSNMDLIENNGYIAEGDSLHYIETKNFLLGADLSDSTQYNIAKTYFDIDNFIENYIMQFYTANISWEHNIKWWRKRSSNGKWRIMLQDLDTTFFYKIPFNHFAIVLILTPVCKFV